MISYDDEHIADCSNLYSSELPTNVPRYDTYVNTNGNVSSNNSGSYNANFQPSAAVGYDCVLNPEPRTWPVDCYYQSSPQSNDIHQRHFSCVGFNNAQPNQSVSSSVDAIEENLLKASQSTVQEDSDPTAEQTWTTPLFTPGTSRPLQSLAMSMSHHLTQVPQVCAICEDKATGKHYGAASCDGCKGFFRRSIRKNQVYHCRFSRNCVIDKDKRNQCRHCRLRKCFSAGMRKEAVQNERDSISCSRKPSFDSRLAANGITVMQLKNADMMFFLQNASRVMSDQTAKNAATLDNIGDSIKYELRQMMEWAKFLLSSPELVKDELINLWKGCAAEQLILGAARRSVRSPNALLLGNNYVIHRCNANGLAGDMIEQEITRIATRVLDELLPIFIEMEFDNTELACLRAILFFDSSAAGPPNKGIIQGIRREIQMTLEDYIRDNNNSRGRFGELMMILRILQSISSQMIEQMQYMNLFRVLDTDPLMELMLLKDESAQYVGMMK